MIDGKPALLDLFCGAGGCTKGYQRAGFYVVGVDLHPQVRYVGEEFYLGDAIEVLKALLAGGWHARPYRYQEGDRVLRLEEFEAIHASPPCQAYSVLRRVETGDRDYPELVDPCRKLLEATGKPYVIENVVGAPLKEAVTLCGSMFGLGCLSGDDKQAPRKHRYLRRHRLFECNFSLMSPQCSHTGEAIGVYGHGGAVPRYDEVEGERRYYHRRGGYQASRAEQPIAMDIDWMSSTELTQAIPPAYTEHVGRALSAHLREVDPNCHNGI